MKGKLVGNGSYQHLFFLPMVHHGFDVTLYTLTTGRPFLKVYNEPVDVLSLKLTASFYLKNG